MHGYSNISTFFQFINDSKFEQKSTSKSSDRCKIVQKERQRSSSTLEDEHETTFLINASGAIQQRDNEPNQRYGDYQISDNYIDIKPVQRRGSIPSKFTNNPLNIETNLTKTELESLTKEVGPSNGATNPMIRLSPPVVRINSPPNNADLEDVEKQLNSMLEATIASIESGTPIKPKVLLPEIESFQGGGQLVDIDDEDSPLSFFTGSFNYFFKPRKRYGDGSYHQEAKYSSWSSDVSTADQTIHPRRDGRRQSMRDIGRAKSLEPSWIKESWNNNHSRSTHQLTQENSPHHSHSSTMDTDDQIDEYMMMLHSNPDLFLASIRKGYLSSEVHKAIDKSPFSVNRALKPKPSMKDIGRARTLEPSWTPESLTIDNRYVALKKESPKTNCSLDVPDIFNYGDGKETNLRKVARSGPEATEVFSEDFSPFRSIDTFPPPAIIVTPPSRAEFHESESNSVSLSALCGRKMRSKSLAPDITEQSMFPHNQEESVKLRKFLSHGNLLGNYKTSMNSTELRPELSLDYNEIRRRYIDRY